MVNFQSVILDSTHHKKKLKTHFGHPGQYGFQEKVNNKSMIDDHIYVNNHKIDKKRHDQSTNFEFFQSTNTSVDARKYCLL